MFGETDLVGVFGVGIVRVDCLGAVRVIRGLWYLSRHIVTPLALALTMTLTTQSLSRTRRSSQVADRRSAKTRWWVLRSRGAPGVSGHRRRGFEAVELGRGVHVRHLAGGRGLGAVAGVGLGPVALTVPVRTMLLLVEGKGIDEAAVRSLGSRPEIENPHDDDHGQEDEACASRLGRGFFLVEQSVGGQGGEDQAGGQIAYNGDIIDMTTIGRENDCDTDNHAQHVGNGPPGVVGKASADIGKDGRNKGDQPGQLHHHQHHKSATNSKRKRKEE